MIADLGRRSLAALRSDEGSLGAYLLFFPVLIMLIELVVIGGRLGIVGGDVEAAAREAARQASIASGPSAGSVVLVPVAQEALNNRGLECQDFDASYAADSNFVAGGQVAVMVTCRVQFTDLGIMLPLPGDAQIRRFSREPIDTYRVVTP